MSGAVHAAALHPPPSLFDVWAAEPTLDDVLAGVWEGLAAHGTVDCPVCARRDGAGIRRARHGRRTAHAAAVCGAPLRWLPEPAWPDRAPHSLEAPELAGVRRSHAGLCGQAGRRGRYAYPCRLSSRGGAMPSRKVRTSQGKVVGNPDPGKPAGKCHRNYTA